MLLSPPDLPPLCVLFFQPALVLKGSGPATALPYFTVDALLPQISPTADEVRTNRAVSGSISHPQNNLQREAALAIS